VPSLPFRRRGSARVQHRHGDAQSAAKAGGAAGRPFA